MLTQFTQKERLHNAVQKNAVLLLRYYLLLALLFLLLLLLLLLFLFFYFIEYRLPGLCNSINANLGALLVLLLLLFQTLFTNTPARLLLFCTTFRA